MTDIETLKAALAKGPTMGPWLQGIYGGSLMPWICDDSGVEVARTSLIRAVDDDHVLNAEYIAACSPDRIQRLVERVEAYEKALEKYVHCGHACTNCTTTKVASAVLAKYAKQGDGG